MGQRQQPFNSTVEASIANFWEDLDTIIDDLGTSLEGMEEKMSTTARYQSFDDAKSSFENFQGDQPDVPEFLSNTKLVYYNDTRTRESQTYNVRRDNMCAMLQAAFNVISGVIEDHGDEFTEEQITEAQELKDVLEAVIEEIENISFE